MDISNEFFLWGAGQYGKQVIKFMKDDLIFRAVIDNNVSKQGSTFEGLPVVSYSKVKHDLPKVKIVVAINSPKEVRKFLTAEGFEEKKDYYIMHDFIPRFFWHKNKSLTIKSVDIAATTKCNMRCNGCITFVPLAKNHKHISAEIVLRNIDLLFSHVDCVMNITFPVGESLLNNALPDICNLIHKKYSKRYVRILVQTNGTVIPKNEDMRCFEKSNTYLCFSNYPESIKSRTKLIEKCEEFGVKYYYNSKGNKDDWCDLGNPQIVNETESIKLKQLYKSCWQPGMALVDGWLYICAAQAWSHIVVEAGTIEPGDAFDLRQPNTDSSREELYKIISRQPPEAGYISHCARCNGVMTPLVQK